MTSSVKLPIEKFVEAVEPGIVSLVVNTFKDKLAQKLEAVVAEVYDECIKELPDRVAVSVKQAFNPRVYGDTIDVHVVIGGVDGKNKGK